VCVVSHTQVGMAGLSLVDGSYFVLQSLASFQQTKQNVLVARL